MKKLFSIAMATILSGLLLMNGCTSDMGEDPVIPNGSDEQAPSGNARIPQERSESSGSSRFGCSFFDAMVTIPKFR